jgi:phytoene synthase
MSKTPVPNGKPHDPVQELGTTALAAFSGAQQLIRRAEDKLRGWGTTLKSNFAFAIATLPPARREGVVALYRFARIADDIADDDGLSLEEREVGIHQLRGDLDRIFGGLEPGHSGLRPLFRTTRDYPVPRSPLDALLDGVAADLRITRYERFEGLHLYCQRVASAVGLACLPVFGCQHPDTRQYADVLGLALQLTNIVRDVGEDAQRGRIYLPLEDLQRFGVDPDDVLQGRRTTAFDQLIRFEADRARAYDRDAQRIWRSLPSHDRRALSAAEIMRTTYVAVLGKVEASGYDVLRPPSGQPSSAFALPLWRRAAIAGATLLRTSALSRA